MSLTGRFSALFLAALGLVLVGLLDGAVRLGADLPGSSACASGSTRRWPSWPRRPRSIPTAWSGSRRSGSIPLGQESGAERLRWMVFDDRGPPRRSLAQPGRRGASRTSWRAPVRSGRRAGWWIGRAGPGGSPGASSGPRSSPAVRLASRGAIAGEPPAPDPAGAIHPSLVLIACAPLGPTEATLATLAWLLAALSAGIWLAAALLCRRLSRRALAPLTRMVESARGLDAADPGWCLDEAGTGDELDDLGRAFNDLLARLHVAYERQRRFSGDASHQLRTPLTVLIGQIEVALRHERSGEEYRRALTSALGRADAARADRRGAAVPQPGRGRGRAARRRADRTASLGRRAPGGPSAGRRRAEVVHRAVRAGALWIQAHPAAPGPVARQPAGQRRQARQRRARRSSSRRSGVRRRPSWPSRTAGPGIAPEDIPHVFEPFYRSARARLRGVAGVGLGLAVVRRIATACGGSVAVQSEPGAGARFRSASR